MEEVNSLDIIQSMISISADRLEGLRTQCKTSATLTQQEIRSLETKLVRMFSELLVTKARLPERIPSSGLVTSSAELRQWLRVVGLSRESLSVCLQRLNTLEQLLEKTDSELKDLLSNNPNIRDEEIRRLTCAVQNLKKCCNAIQNNCQEPENLFWDSWDRHHHAYYNRNMNSVNAGASTSSSSPRSYRMMNKQTNKAKQSPMSSSSEHVAQSPSAIGTTAEDHNMHSSMRTLTPSPSPPNSPFLTNKAGGSGNTTSTQKLGYRKSGTPPPKRKHQTLLSHHPSTPSHIPSTGNATMSNQNNFSSTSLQDATLTKSKSHESPLIQESPSQTITAGSSFSQNKSSAVTTMVSSQQHLRQQQYQQQEQQSQQPILSRTRLHTEPGPDLQSHQYNTESVVENVNNLTVPRSPCTPIVSLGMGHMIAHRFTKVLTVMSSCDLCQKQMFFGLKCKECKYMCHKDCEPNVPPSCGLPREFVDEFKKTLQSSDVFLPNTSPNLSSRAGYLSANRRQKASVTNYHALDSSSPGSSCNSSSPSSPALFNVNASHHSHSSHTSSNHGSQNTPSSAQKHAIQFNFPDVTVTTSSSQSSSQSQSTPSHEAHSSQNNTPSANTSNSCSSNVIANTNLTNVVIAGTPPIKNLKQNLSGNHIRPPLSELSDTHKSNDSDKTVSLSGSTSASTDSDRTPVRLDSTEEGDSGHWPRQNSLSLKEWDIPYDDLRLLEKIGQGRFGTVHRALWHGDVAVKLLKKDYLDDDRTLEAFKLEVANFKKTRHENLVLFMGACMNPPYLAIVTSLCKGNTLYTYIHSRRDKFNLNRTTLVATQISQGMGYLHARGIFHKDLRTKNIFLENGKVIITDFGLFSSTKLAYSSTGLAIPKGWLCYLAPELIRALTPYRPTDEILPFSKASDTYSFGTVWYELLCGEFPFKSQPPEAVIWQAGRGMKQTLANLQTSRDVKDILMLCWSFQADDRPDFPKLLTLLERLPKKRLARSPSHPVQLSRSAESVF